MDLLDLGNHFFRFFAVRVADDAAVAAAVRVLGIFRNLPVSFRGGTGFRKTLDDVEGPE